MIYKKDANFPYPLLTNTSNSYDGCNFILDIGLNENTYDYIIQIDYDIESDFIKKLIEEDKARLVLVVQSKDNKFYNLKLGQNTISITKNRISLIKGRTTIQLLIQSKEEINFKENNDLNPFYGSIKDQINVPKHSVLGFSNSVILDGNSIPNQFKVYMADTGLFISMLEPGTAADILQGNLYGYKGAIFENLVADIFGKMNRKLYYFRKDSGLEIDFVTRYEGKCTLVEVKASNGNIKSAKTILSNPEKYHVSQAIKLGDVNVGTAPQTLIFPLYMAFLLKNK